MRTGTGEGRRERVVLVVDDDRDACAFLCAVLTLPELAAGGPVRVMTAPDAETALALTHGRVPDLVLLDVVLPDADGFALCRRLRLDPRLRAVPVVAFSGLGRRAETEQRARAAGCDGYLPRPVDLDELIATARRWLDGAAPAVT